MGDVFPGRTRGARAAKRPYVPASGMDAADGTEEVESRKDDLGRRASGGGRWDAGWAAQLAKLTEYKRKHGDCNVPRDWAEDPRLGTWVNTQRKGKKMLDRGEPGNGLTPDRIAKLEAHGFEWKLSVAARSKQLSQTSGTRDDAGWAAQLAKLKEYQLAHSNCNVPKGSPRSSAFLYAR